MKDVRMACVRSGRVAGLRAPVLPMLHAKAGTRTSPACGAQVMDVHASLSVGDVTFDFMKDVAVTGTPVPDLLNMHQSGVEGIGVRFSVTNSHSGQLVWVPVTQMCAVPVSGTMKNDVCADFIVTGSVRSGSVNPANRSSSLSLASGSLAAGAVNQRMAGTLAGGAMRVRLTARHVRTSGTLVPGSVDGKATFTMSYQ